MRLWQYTNTELLNAAEMAFWMNDQKFADYVMEELATRIVEEHPPDGPRPEELLSPEDMNGPRLEIEIEESSEETGSAAKAEEADYDDNCFGNWRS